MIERGPHPAPNVELADLAAVRDELFLRIAEAAARAGRPASAVELVAITKTVSPDRIRVAYEVGFRAFGENRVQERQEKAAALGDLVPPNSSTPSGEAPANGIARPLQWHLVGPLQSNKARRAVELFDVIETVDSLELAQRLDRIAAELKPGTPLLVLLQVNVDADAAKSGFEPAALDRDLGAVLDLRNLSIHGLMTVGRLVDDPELARPTFVALREMSERLRGRHAGLGAALSMGMTDDYAVAVEEGATIVRIGRAIFGTRPAVR